MVGKFFFSVSVSMPFWIHKIESKMYLRYSAYDIQFIIQRNTLNWILCVLLLFIRERDTKLLVQCSIFLLFFFLLFNQQAKTRSPRAINMHVVNVGHTCKMWNERNLYLSIELDVFVNSRDQNLKHISKCK